MRSEDLSDLFTGPNPALPVAPVVPTTTRQGRIITFDAVTGENTVQVGTEVMTNLPVDAVGAVPLAVDDVVQIDTTSPSWFIKGRVSDPGEGVVPTWPADIDQAQTSADQAALDAATAQAAADALQVDLDTLNDVTLPALQTELDGILPITETDIADDAITTPKIAANAVTANEIAANTITANEMAADSITANELTADAIDGKVITGALFRTVATGARVEIGDNPTTPGATDEEVRFHSGDPDELQYAVLKASNQLPGEMGLLIRGFDHTLENGPYLSFTTTATEAHAELESTLLSIYGPLTEFSGAVDVAEDLTQAGVPVVTTATTFPYSRARFNVDASLASSAGWTVVSGWTVEASSGITYSAGVWTVPTAGRYRITATLCYASNTTGTRGIRLVTGATQRLAIVSIGMVGGFQTSVSASATYALAAGGTLSVAGQQNSSNPLAIKGDADGTWSVCFIEYVGP